MKQDELSLDTTMFNIMNAPKPPVGWRRAHEKVQPCGNGRIQRKKIIVDPVIVNAASRAEKKAMLEKIKHHPGAAPKQSIGDQQNLF